MTSQGHGYARFQRALRSGDAVLATAAARELASISLDDALALVLLFRESPARYRRAATRWHGRLCLETPDIGLADAHLALIALRMLERDAAAAGVLAVVCERHGLWRAAARLRHEVGAGAGRGGDPRP